MALSDIEITQWSTDAAGNPPSDGALIGRNHLAGQFRNLKSVVRQQSLEKQWQRTGMLGFGQVNTLETGSAILAIVGDVAAQFTPRRKVRLRPASGAGSATYVYAGVRNATYDGAAFTIIELPLVSGSFVDDLDYLVDFGTEDPAAPSLPFFAETGRLTIEGEDDSGFALFRSLPGALADNYFFKAMVVSTTSNDANATIITGISKLAAGATITLRAAPGANNNTVISWLMVRPTS